MSRKTVVALASAVTLSAWNVASAQPKMIQGATVTGSATVEAVEQGPQGWKYSTKVKDKADLDGVKVGDRFDVAWTEGVLVSLGSPKQ